MKKQENKRGEAGERPWLRATLAALRGGLLACGAAVLLLLVSVNVREARAERAAKRRGH